MLMQFQISILHRKKLWCEWEVSEKNPTNKLSGLYIMGNLKFGLLYCSYERFQFTPVSSFAEWEDRIMESITQIVQMSPQTQAETCFMFMLSMMTYWMIKPWRKWCTGVNLEQTWCHKLAKSMKQLPNVPMFLWFLLVNSHQQMKSREMFSFSGSGPLQWY